MKTKLQRIKHLLRLIKIKLLLSQVDFVIVTYPKTGSTWLQLLIRKIYITHFNLDEKYINHVFLTSISNNRKLPKELPRTYITHGMPNFNNETYDQMTLDNTLFKQKKIILLIRDPRDTLVSLYFHNKYRSTPPVYTGDISAMIYDKIYGIHKYINFYKSWYKDLKLVKNLLLIRYEDLQSSPHMCLRRICDYMGLNNVTDEVINMAIDFCSFNNMKKAEMENSTLPGLNRSKNLCAEAFKVRQGIVGGHKEYLREEDALFIEKCSKEQLPSIYHYP